MRESVLPLLCCPACGGDLACEARTRASDDHVMEGSLLCRGCRATYPVSGGIPRLLAGDVRPESTETARRFGDQWRTFDHMSSYQEEWLLGWLHPLGPADFAGKVVFEGGCGKGRHTVVVSGWGARAVVALDLGHAVEVAFGHSRHLENAHVVQGDLLHPPVKRAFDLAFSVGVLHHLPDPRAGFESVKSLVVPGGRIAIWVYGYESNEWIVRWVSPVRERVTARMPHSLLYWLSLPPSATLAAASKLYRFRGLARRLPYRDYMARLATVPLKEVHDIVFDQLVTPIAYYLPEDEVRSWFQAPDLRDVTIGWHNKNSWRASAVVAA